MLNFKSVISVVLLLPLLLSCQGIKNSDKRGFRIPNSEFYDYRVDGTVTGWIKHEEVVAKFENTKLRDEYTFNSFLRPFWDLDGNTGYNGSWKLHFSYFEYDSKVNDIVARKIRNKDSLTDGFGDSVTLLIFLKDNQPPSCTIVSGGRCGGLIRISIEEVAEPRKTHNVEFMATKGEINFDTLAPQNVGDHMIGTIHVTDEKHFDLTYEIDAEIIKVEKF